MKKKNLILLSFVPLLSLFFIVSCNTSTLFTPIGSHLSGPIAVAVDTARNRAYVVNSNNDYAYTNATLSILDITTPTAPTLVTNTQNPVPIPNLSSGIYLDTATQRAFVPNRLSDNDDDHLDNLLRINVDESSGTFGAVDIFTAGDNPFGSACCDTSGRLYMVNLGGTLEVYDLSDLAHPTSLSLAGTFVSGASYSGANSVEVLLLGTQAFVTNRGGRIYVINTGEIGTTANPIDYLITNVGDARGIATDGTLLYVIDGSVSPGIVRVINPATLTPVTPDSAARTESDILASSSIQTATVTVGRNPNKILIFGGKAYVSNQDDDTITVFTPSAIGTDGFVTSTIAVGDRPFGLTAFTSGSNNYLYVTNLFSNSISIVDLSNNTVAATFAP